jgi:hypothetical protein
MSTTDMMGQNLKKYRAWRRFAQSGRGAIRPSARTSRPHTPRHKAPTAPLRSASSQARGRGR